MPDTYSFIPASQTDLNAVTARVETLEGKVDQHQSLLGSILETLQRNSQMAQDNNSLLHKVLTVVSGQREPGLERPGLADDLRSLVAVVEKMQAALDTLRTAENRRQGWLAGVVGIATLLGMYFYESLHALLTFITHLPPAK